MKTNNLLMLIAVGAGAYFLFKKSNGEDAKQWLVANNMLTAANAAKITADEAATLKQYYTTPKTSMPLSLSTKTDRIYLKYPGLN